jgi:hypothetical protein
MASSRQHLLPSGFRECRRRRSEVGFAINAVKKRATINGDIERAVHHITTGKVQIVRCSAEERSEHNQDREGICDDLAGSFNIRYLTALPDPIVKAL